MIVISSNVIKIKIPTDQSTSKHTDFLKEILLNYTMLNIANQNNSYLYYVQWRIYGGEGYGR